jgi:hypothetical protein
MECKLLIGTKFKQIYIDGFLQGTNKQYTQFSAQGQLVNGLPYIVQSTIQGATQKEMRFKRNKDSVNNGIKKLFDGSLGDGFLYYADPYAHNILPLSWSIPSNQDNNGVGFDAFQSAVLVPVPDNTLSLPVQGAHIVVPNNGYTVPYTFVVPDDNDLVIGIKGVPGTITNFTLTWGTHTIQVPINSDLSTIYDLVLSRDDYPNAGRMATLTLPTPGECDLYALQLSYTTPHATKYSVQKKLGNEFYSGEGMCGGVMFENVELKQYESNRYSKTQEFGTMTFVATEWGNL